MMPASQEQTLKELKLRADLPRYFRIGAVILLCVVLGVIGYNYFFSDLRSDFRMKSLPTSLSDEVTAEIIGYERREMENGLVKYFIKADKATTFTDNHQELENVLLQAYDAEGEKFDQITSAKAIYIPGEEKDFTAFFAGNVIIDSRDGLNVKTEQLTYKHALQIADAEELITFERENVKGKSVGAIVKTGEKRLELLKDVEIETLGSSDVAATNVSRSKLNAGSAIYDQANEKIELHGGVKSNINTAEGRIIDVEAARANIFLIEKTENSREVSKAELFEKVVINSKETNGQPAVINADQAIYTADQDRFDLTGNVYIKTVESDKPTEIRAANAIYTQSTGKVDLNGGAEIAQQTDLVKGDKIDAELFPDRSLKKAVVTGNGYVKQTDPKQTAEVFAPELTAIFAAGQKLLNASAVGSSRVILTPAQASEFSKMTTTAPRSINVDFNAGVVKQMQTDGRTTIDLNAPGNDPSATNKKLTADSVKTYFHENGNSLRRAEAVGTAELYIDPVGKTPETYQTAIFAPRFDCDFYETGNNAKECLAATGTKAVRTPSQPSPERGKQTITSKTMKATFARSGNDLERIDADGNAKFVEGERNAIANSFVFTTKDEVIRLRGGSPTAWDGNARIKANEIDIDTKNDRSSYRGNVSTTYYSQGSTGGAAPFAATDKPVYTTSNDAIFDHKAQVATFTGNARGWQENNYVRADNFRLEQSTGKFYADGNVQSLLYDAKRKENGNEVTVPVYASSAKMSYDRNSRVIRYEDSVDIRQGTDRISSGVANVYLSEKNEVARTDVEKNVVIIQPNRRASGDFASYTADNETVVLRGNPASVEDSESGRSRGSELTVNLAKNRVTGSGATQQNPEGRTRSVYKIKNR